MAKPLAVIVGVGPGMGYSLCRTFVGQQSFDPLRLTCLQAKKGFTIAACSRSPEKLKPFIEELGADAAAFPLDLGNIESVQSAFKTIRDQFNQPLKVAVANAASGFRIQSILEVDPQEANAGIQTGGTGSLVFVQEAAKWMLDQKDQGGSILFTGATASLRGSAKFSTFAAGSFARRAIVQSSARELGPRGIHVGLVVVDGIIDTPRTRDMFGTHPTDESWLDPDAVAGMFVHLHEQPKSCWTDEVVVRPWKEKF